MSRVKKLIVTVILFMIPVLGFGQNIPLPTGPPPPPGLPIDGISDILFIIGLLYGVVKTLKDSSS